MPPFQYQTYHNPFVQSISALLQAPGQIEAQRAQTVGNAQANAALQSGQAWGGAVAGAGQAVGGALEQAIDPRRKLQAIQLQEAQAKVADMKALDAAYSQPGGREAILKALPGHLKPTVQAQFDSSDKAHADAAKAQEEAARLETEAFADTAAAVKAHGYDPTSAQLALSDLKTKYASNPARLQQIQQAEAALHQNPTPETVQSIVDPLIQASPKRLELEQTAALHAETIRHNQETERNSALTQGREAAQATETARHNAALERLQQTNIQREQAAQSETARHNRATEAANNPLAALTGQAAQSPTSAVQAEGLHGEDFLKTLPGNVASEVKAYAEGRRPFPAGFALKSPYFQSLIQMVGQYDPTFDAVNYNARSKTRNDFTSGKSAQTINALNTVTQHLSRLSDRADALNNSWSPTYNTIANFVSRQTGNRQVTDFETDKKAVVDELTRAWRQAGGSEGDIRSWSSVLDASNSPAQLHGAIAEMGQLLEGKLSALENQYKQGMGTTDTTGLNVVTPEARQTLDKLEKRSGGSTSAAPAEGTKGVVNGRKATWKTVNGKTGWYAD